MQLMQFWHFEILLMILHWVVDGEQCDVELWMIVETFRVQSMNMLHN
jgi:hypothetical protein